jgi:hypothetical protein
MTTTKPWIDVRPWTLKDGYVRHDVLLCGEVVGSFVAAPDGFTGEPGHTVRVRADQKADTMARSIRRALERYNAVVSY